MAEKNAEKHVDHVTTQLNERGVAYGDGEPIPDKLSAGRLKQEWTRLQRFEQQVKKREKSIADERENLAQQKASIEQGREALTEERDALTIERNECDEARSEVAAREAKVVAQERELNDREEAARAGFAAQNREQLEILKSERDAMRARMEEDRRAERERADAERAALQEELDAARAEARRQIESWNQEHADELRQHEDARLDVERRERALREQTELLTVERELWEDRKEQEIELRSADARAEAQHFRTLLTQVERQRDELSQAVAELEGKLTRLGDDPDAIVRRLEEARQANERLRDELASRPTLEEAERLRTQAQDRDRLFAELVDLRRSEAELQGAVRRQSIAVNDLEVLRDERDALEQQKAALRAAINDLKEQLGELRDLDDNKLPFPACSSYDEDAELQRPIETLDEIDLKTLVRMVQGEMAAAGFHYRQLDIQLFIGGLASSRLHLLQGLSGTGKTSLPLQFAKAIGGDASVVEVQAGWRDRDDLFGYYNAFEGRYYESEFTKALYRASMPKWSSSPVVIVLDEMNLSHPEQYFGVMLSKLELAGTGKARIDLVSRPLQHTPRSFIGGAELPWPRNVWFVGTANHDETTVSFADKTYDRAHVQELPAEHPATDQSRRWDVEPLSLEALEVAFTSAQEEHAYTSEKLVEFFRSQLAPAFHGLGVSWGNRIDAQMRTFVPVAHEAGATLGEAADHILSTKILRKVRDRHDLTPDVLEALGQHIEERWSQVDPQPPSTTLSIIGGEVRRMRGEFDDFMAD